MPIDAPTGFLTRPEAARQYNRSQRALERDLDVALAIQDRDMLANWKLVTKDGQIRDGGDVTIDMVKQFVTDGMTPAWLISESFLENKYGKKGEPRPSASLPKPDVDRLDSSNLTDEPKQPSTSPSTEEVAFLREIIQRLEKEKDQERHRHDNIVAKLFAELDVKNKQISAWDGVTQGLTKALATGQIAPNRGLLSVSKDVHETSMESATTPIPTTETSAKPEIINTPESKEDRNKAPASRKKVKAPPTEKEKPSEKPKWYEMPTIKGFFSRSK